MKIPIIRQLAQNLDEAQLEASLAMLEVFTEARGVSEEEINVAGELITNICGALEVKAMIQNGMRDSEALNAFSKKVLGSVDKA